jgi:sodium-dependent phosphate cotransporter
LVVPLAGMGLFDVRRIFPFIMGANIGTCFTALIAAGSKVGEPGFELGLTAAFAHLLLNTLAVLMVTVIPGIQTGVIRWSLWIADLAVAFPGTLMVYLVLLVFVAPALIYAAPYALSLVLFSALVVVLLVGPFLFLTRAGSKSEEGSSPTKSDPNLPAGTTP